MIKWPLTVVLALAALAALAAPAVAVLSGENGRIVFTSGREAGDAQAKLYLLPVPSSTGGGSVSRAFDLFAFGQYRHPTWSPDRTKIAYAQGTAGSATTEDFDIFIHDLTTGAITPITNTGDSLSADRPAWSPDGTRIAYEHQPTDNSAERDIRVQTVGTLAAPLDLTTGPPIEHKAAWSPDSQTIYYGFLRALPNPDFDIVSEPASGGAVSQVLNATTVDEFQPSISPDGTKMCFTLQTAPADTSTADVYVTALPTGGAFTPISTEAGVAEYNCTWSPDGQLLAFVIGAFSAGGLNIERADGTSLSPIELTNAAGVFDGNPDWAPDARPLCPDSTATTSVNTPVTITVTCTDTGPAYEQTEVREFKKSDPANGTVTQEFAGDPFVYTPKPGFTGTDSFTISSFDELGFGGDDGTVTITVSPTPPPPPPPPPPPICGGKPATIVGTAGNDTLNGTPGADVIAGLGGNDTIQAARGNDIVCGGSGRDRVGGGAGRDRASGNSGNDRVGGGTGNDRVSGGTGNDRISGNAGRDSLFGGIGRDRLSGGSGRDRLDGGANQDICRGGPSTDTGTRCESSFGLEL